MPSRKPTRSKKTNLAKCDFYCNWRRSHRAIFGTQSVHIRIHAKYVYGVNVFGRYNTHPFRSLSSGPGHDSIRLTLPYAHKNKAQGHAPHQMGSQSQPHGVMPLRWQTTVSGTRSDCYPTNTHTRHSSVYCAQT